MPHSMRSRVYTTVWRPSVCLSVPSGRRTPLLQVCCCGPGGQEISIDWCSSGGQVRAVPRCQRNTACLSSWTSPQAKRLSTQRERRFVTPLRAALVYLISVAAILVASHPASVTSQLQQPCTPRSSPGRLIGLWNMGDGWRTLDTAYTWHYINPFRALMIAVMYIHNI